MNEVIIETYNLINDISKERKEAEEILEKNSQLLDDKLNTLCLNISVKICAFIDEKIPKICQIYKKKIKIKSNSLCWSKKYFDQFNMLVKRYCQSLKLKDRYFELNSDNFSYKEIEALERLPLYILFNDNHTITSPRELDLHANFLTKALNIDTKEMTYLYQDHQICYNMPQPLLIHRLKENSNVLLDNKGYNIFTANKYQNPSFWDIRSLYSVYKNNQGIIKLSDLSRWQDEVIILLYKYNTNNFKSIIATRNDILRIQRNIRGYIHQNNSDNNYNILWNNMVEFCKEKNDFCSKKIINISTLSMAHEVEYSWDNYIASLLSKETIKQENKDK